MNGSMNHPSNRPSSPRIGGRFGMMAMLAGLFGGLGGMGSQNVGRVTYDPHNKTCANPGCKKRTISSEFCCLTCAVLAKRKDQE